MNTTKQANRHELSLAVWAAEFARVIGSSVDDELKPIADRAAQSADRVVKALDLYLFEGVEFTPAGYYMSWEEFYASCNPRSRGHGKWATADGRVSSEAVSAVDGEYDRPAWATHVVWYGDRPEPPTPPIAPTIYELQWLASIYAVQLRNDRTKPNMEILRVFDVEIVAFNSGSAAYETAALPLEVRTSLYAKQCIEGRAFLRVTQEGLKHLETAARDVHLMRTVKASTTEMPVAEALRLSAELKSGTLKATLNT